MSEPDQRDIAPRVSPSDAELESLVRGKTLLVYLFALRSKGGKVGVREVQRALSFSSPSVAAYHLQKLEDLGIMKKNPTGQYLICRRLKLGIMNQYIVLGQFSVPRHLFYASFTSILFFGYFILFWLPRIPMILVDPLAIWTLFTTDSIFVFLIGGPALVFFWFETVKAYLSRPF